MKRNAELFLKEWFTKPPKKPLLLRGARQVGKSTLVKNFCQNNGIKLLEVNLEKRPLEAINSNNIDVTKILQEIELVTNQYYHKDQPCLVFIDEIQAQPKAITALRYFYEELPHVAIIAAGSLLEIILDETEEISFPVGRILFYHLGPMTFSEFLQASGQEVLYNTYLSSDSIHQPQLLHSSLSEYYRLYLVVGGMPEAVKVYFETKSLLDVKEVHQSIIDTYIADFPKYGRKKQIPKLELIFSMIPKIVGEKLKYVNINKEMKSRDIKSGIELLLKARVISAVYHSNASGIPIESQKDESVLKIFFLDVGLWNHLMHTNPLDIINDKELLTTGKMTEQFAAQHLLFISKGRQAPHLYYWLKDKDSKKAEVDFVIEHESKVIPIEVKASKSKRMKSLMWFLYEKKLNFGIKISSEPYSVSHLTETLSDGQNAVLVEGKILSIPFYFIEKLSTLIN